ncbi:MAG: septal ring lytic transglycosylase RlpA family protein [Pseudomonadota bacterium]
MTPRAGFIRSIFFGGFFLAAVGITPVFAADAATAKEPPAPHRVQIGDASWYGSHHEGHRTASGEAYDPQLLTAAHPSLPLDSTVRVTNLKNGRSVDVRVNDRGPYKSRRVIDLSAKAAETIGLKRRGVAKVKVEALPHPPPPAVYHAERAAAN